MVSAILAATPEGGIGYEGSIPWRIKEDMDYFKRITTTGEQNVVIMGRRTWESIPAKYRPLPQRINVVITSSSYEARDHLVYASLGEALDNLGGSKFVIGGARLYNETFTNPACETVYLTRVTSSEPIVCDTFVDLSLLDQYHLQEQSEIKKDGKFTYQFLIYRRKC
ncbi:MAG: dihydrofolate reductase [Nitrososphaerales archaeon]